MKRPAVNLDGEIIIGKILIREVHVSVNDGTGVKNLILSPCEYDFVAYNESAMVYICDAYHKHNKPLIIHKTMVTKVIYY